MFNEFIDISRPLYEGMPIYPGDTPYSKQLQLSIEAGAQCNLSSFTVSMHGGTHVDAPRHFIRQGPGIDQLDLKRFFGKVRVLEFWAEQPLEADDLRQLGIVSGERLLLKLHANEAVSSSGQLGMVNVGLRRSAADFLVEQEVKLVGINCGSIEAGFEGPYEAHARLLGAGVIIVENLVLAGVQPGEYYLACFPLKLENGDGAPARAVLMR